MSTCIDHEKALDDVLSRIRDCLRETSMRKHVPRLENSLGGGKMLRARLVQSVGLARGASADMLCRAGAAVEMLHCASLLHDDLVDGGTLRRGEPAIWVSEGSRAAVLLGDLLVSLSATEVQSVLPGRLPMLVETLREMCDADANQEFNSGGSRSWNRCVAIARRKTGSLFGVAAACAAGTDDACAEALRKAGYALGTAYQLADDLLDAREGALASDKTLGTDLATGKLTAASACPPDGASCLEVIEEFLRGAEAELDRWPKVQKAWREYVSCVVEPLIERFTVEEDMEAFA